MRLLNMEYVHNYIATQHEVLYYVKANEDCPLIKMTEAKIALEKLREHLDYLGFKMPRPHYLYNHHDVRTWQFIPTTSNSGYKKMYIQNPKFKYRIK